MNSYPTTYIFNPLNVFPLPILDRRNISLLPGEVSLNPTKTLLAIAAIRGEIEPPVFRLRFFIIEEVEAFNSLAYLNHYQRSFG
jgi:hypothetical protein